MKLLSSAFAALLLIVCTFPVSAKTVSKPNVIILLTDDQGYGDLSCHGNPVLKTPNLDKIHDESIRLIDFHAAPMCTPTRGQLMTGVDALRNGAMNVSSGRTLLRTEFPTMAEIFAKSGYRTGIFGKWHLGDNYPYRPQDRGFQKSIWIPSSHISSAPDFWNNDYFDDVYMSDGKRESFQGYCTDVFFGEAMDWMRTRAKLTEPFFCYLPVNAPHAPLFVPNRFREPYRSQKDFVASFFGMIANIDENVGKLDAFLRENGLAENTILIFMTDNGTANGESVFNAGMRGKKVDLHEGGHRVPFFIRWPNGKLRSASDLYEPTEVQDVLPTLMDLCNLKKPRGARFDGISLAQLLRGESDTLPDRMLVSQFSRINDSIPRKNDAVVLWKKWRLISGNELYNLANDFGQKTNVIGKFPEIASRMQAHYDEWWKKIEPRVNEFSPIHLGSPEANPVMLTPCDWRDVFLDQQAQIRRKERNGAWTVFIERGGNYEITLRRWPVEADLAITEAAPGYKAADGIYAPGHALPIARAELKIGDANKSANVRKADKEISFVLPLKKGRTEMQTWFRDANGKELCGAYYVYVSGPVGRK